MGLRFPIVGRLDPLYWIPSPAQSMRFGFACDNANMELTYHGYHVGTSGRPDLLLSDAMRHSTLHLPLLSASFRNPRDPTGAVQPAQYIGMLS